MTTLTKTALFTFDPGSPFVPEIVEYHCVGLPDPPVYPTDPNPAPSPGLPAYPYGAIIITDRNGQGHLYPRCPPGTSGCRI